jgi:hypothetical protein
MIQSSVTKVPSPDWTYQRQTELWDILSCNSSIWSTEIMHNVPESLNDYPPDWLAALKQLSQEELWLLDAKFLTPELEKKMPTSELQWLKRLRYLEEVPKINLTETAKAPAEIFLGMRAKKQYEVEKLGSLVSQTQANSNSSTNSQYDWILDIGGGSGHLMRYLTYQNLAQNYFCLDGSSDNLKFGLAKWTRISKALSKTSFPWVERIHYHPINHFLSDNTHASELKDFLPAEVRENNHGLVIGLHTCGDLALGQTQLSQQLTGSACINMPCCYLKLDPQKQVNLAEFTRQHAYLEWNNFALTLATRAHGRFTQENYLNKRQVKYFRYGIHLVLMEFFNRSDIHQVHEAPLAHYYGDFSYYANTKLEQLGLGKLDEIKLDKFFQSEKTQNLIETMFFANLYRWQFGRSLELSLLLDRVHWIREMSKNCQIGELFDESISPRNLVLTW